MRYDRASFHAATKGASTITLHFTDTDPGMPQMDNMISRQVTLGFQEWAKLVQDVEKISGIKDMIAMLEGKEMCRCVYPDKCFCDEQHKT